MDRLQQDLNSVGLTTRSSSSSRFDLTQQRLNREEQFLIKNSNEQHEKTSFDSSTKFNHLTSKVDIKSNFEQPLSSSSDNKNQQSTYNTVKQNFDQFESKPNYSQQSYEPIRNPTTIVQQQSVTKPLPEQRTLTRGDSRPLFSTARPLETQPNYNRPVPLQEPIETRQYKPITNEFEPTTRLDQPTETRQYINKPITKEFESTTRLDQPIETRQYINKPITKEFEPTTRLDQSIETRQYINKPITNEFESKNRLDQAITRTFVEQRRPVEYSNPTGEQINHRPVQILNKPPPIVDNSLVERQYIRPAVQNIINRVPVPVPIDDRSHIRPHLPPGELIRRESSQQLNPVPLIPQASPGPRLFRQFVQRQIIPSHVSPILMGLNQTRQNPNTQHLIKLVKTEMETPRQLDTQIRQAVDNRPSDNMMIRQQENQPRQQMENNIRNNPVEMKQQQQFRPNENITRQNDNMMRPNEEPVVRNNPPRQIINNIRPATTESRQPMRTVENNDRPIELQPRNFESEEVPSEAVLRRFETDNTRNLTSAEPPDSLSSLRSGLMPSGKPVAKEMTITVTGRLPPQNKPQPMSNRSEEEKLWARENSSEQEDDNMEYNNGNRNAQRPTDLNLSNNGDRRPKSAGDWKSNDRKTSGRMTPASEKAVSFIETPRKKISETRNPGTWCAQTGRFIPSEFDRPKSPDPRPKTPTTPRKKKLHGTYCAKTGRYIPPGSESAPTTPDVRPRTPKEDLHVSFTDTDIMSPRNSTSRVWTPRIAKKPNIAFGRVINEPDTPRRRIRRTKSNDWADRRYRSIDGDHDSGVEDTAQDHATSNGQLKNGQQTRRAASKIPAHKRATTPGSPSTGTPLKSPGKAFAPRSASLTPEPTAERKKLPMNKIQVGNAPSPNLKQVRSKIGSLENATHKPGGGQVKIENRKIDFQVTSRIVAKNDSYQPGGGEKKIQSQKLQWNAKSKIGSLENTTHKAGGGEKKIESQKLEFKDKAKSKIGSTDNIKHKPGGGNVKIENQKLDFKEKVGSKVGSLANVTHKPGGGDVKIFDDKEYLKQMGGTSTGTVSKASSEGQPSGTQSPILHPNVQSPLSPNRS